MIIAGTSVTFTPEDGVLVLRGTESSEGVIEASQTITTSAPGEATTPTPKTLDTPTTTNAKTVLRFRGQRDGNSVHGTYSSPHCQADVALTRV